MTEPPEEEPDNGARALAAIDAILAATGGPVTPDEKAWADAILRSGHPDRAGTPCERPAPH